jgi:hypothetical protein
VYDLRDLGVKALKVYSYVVRYDDGAAPNPFWQYCTLAICKPAIRRVAKRGDWVVGTGSKENVGNNRLIYAMKVTETLTIVEYEKDSRFACKIPTINNEIKKLGDNLYYVDAKGEMRQRFPSVHSYEQAEKPETKRKDLNGKNVLISGSGSFWYFGKNAPKIPRSLMKIVKKGTGHKWKFEEPLIADFLNWIGQMKPGVYGDPCGNSALPQKKQRKCAKEEHVPTERQRRSCTC